MVGIEQDTDAVTATFASGVRITARLLIGADGVHSIVRDKAGIEFDAISTGASFSLGPRAV